MVKTQSSKDSTAIISVFVIPRNQYRFQYQINMGKFHAIKKEEAFEYLSQFVPYHHYRELRELLLRFRPFIILVQEEEVIELKKEYSKPEYYKKNLISELESVTNSPVRLFTEDEHIENDNLLSKFYDKIRGIEKSEKKF